MDENPFRLDGKRALVTGGSQGIGLGIARAFVRFGAEVVLVARDYGALESAQKELGGYGGKVSIYSFDMTQTERISAFFERVVNEVGSIDILVNNAGGTRRAPAEEQTIENWDFVINLNLTSVFTISLAFGRELIAKKRPGKIINIGSLMSEAARVQNVPYAASKGGIRMMTKAFAADWARHNINVNAIGPGTIATPLTAPLQNDPDFDSWVKRRTPLARWGTPEDIAGAAVYLASAASDFVTGQILYVDGGILGTY